MFVIDFETFIELYGDDIAIEFSELGMTYELDSEMEDYEEKQYEDYCNRIGKWSNSS
jgi:hypothetical protein